MKLHFTLSTYIGRQFLTGILTALAVFSLLLLMVDTVELFRRASSRAEVPVNIVMSMAMLKLPDMMRKVLPFAVLIGGILALSKLTRTHELVVARAAGISVWQFLLPALMLVTFLSFVELAVFSPLSAATLSRFEQMEAKYFKGRPSLLAVSSSGLWLRQIDEHEGGEKTETIVHAMRVSQKDMELYDVIIFKFDAQGAFTQRLNAKSAKLRDGSWQLNNVLLTAPDQPAERMAEYTLPTNLTSAQIQDSFASPETLSFWELPGFIKTLEDAGFSGLRHRLYWHSALSAPLLFCAMVLIAAVFSLRLPRRGGAGMMVAAGIFTGFVMYFLTDLVFAFGMSGTIPVQLAAWAPATVAAMIGIALLLHLEDG